MRIVPTLLRLILALSLVLNGTGLASAHAGDDPTHPTASADVDAPTLDELPCHEAPGPAVTKHEPDAREADGGVAAAGVIDHQAEPDCCDLGTCDNACPQPLSAALMAAAGPGQHGRPASLPQAMSGNRPGPLLPHPIRPPIA